MTNGKKQGRPLRVVHVTWGLSVGGLEKLLVEFARHTNPKQVALHFISLGSRGELAELIEDSGWPVTALNEPEGLRPQLIVRLARLIRGAGADVVHTHSTRGLVYGGPAARLAGVKRLVHTWHGWDLTSSPRAVKLFRVVGRLPDWIVAVSRDAASLMTRHGIPPRKICTIWNGIDTERFAYAGADPNGPAVSVARLSPEKDFPTLIRAAAIVVARRGDFRLEIAGDGACLGDLQDLVSRLCVENCVRFLGQVEDVPGLLSRASMFVLPSLREGISLTLLEAMATGLPVVATRVGGNSEVVDERKTGLLVPSQSPEELAAALLQLLNDTEARQAMGRAGRERVEQAFDIRRMVSEYEYLYRGATAKKTPVLVTK